MTPRRRSFYGWGYENEPLPAGELEWFEHAWAGQLGDAAGSISALTCSGD